MNSTARAFVTVDMRGLKAALVERARAERVSVSVVVRRAVERELRLVDATRECETVERPAVFAGPTVKLSIRLTSAEAEQLVFGARRAGLSRSAFLAGLVSHIRSLTGATASRPEVLAALTASSAELSALCRNINHLTSLLRQGEVRAAQEYRLMLDTLGADVRAHLRLAAGALAELRPARQARTGTEARNASA